MRLLCTGPRPTLDVTDGALGLTGPQQQALAIDRELVVTAGAGAGKTMVLSLRYVALLLELAGRAVESDPLQPRPDIAAVLVLTFTEKAAEEMAERCYRRLLELAERVREHPDTVHELASAYGPEHPARLAAALDHLVDHFEQARIGTFHGFCAEVLRTFPAETGTPPDFEVLDEVDGRELRERIVDEVLVEAYETDGERVRRLVDSAGSHRSTRDALLHALGRRTVLRRILSRHARGEVTIRDLFDLFPQTPAQLLHWLEMAALPVLEEILNAVALSGGGKRIPEIHRVRARIDDLLEALDPDALDIADAYLDVLQTLCTANGRKVRALNRSDFVGTKDAWRSIGLAHWQDARDQLELTQDLVQDWAELLEQGRGLPTRADVSMLAGLQVLGELFDRSEARLLAHFERDSVLDFDALQERAVELVTTDDAVRDRLAARHRYLMVDEFQDTDSRQWALVKALGRPDDRPADRIFAVGDAKQAIYRFRGGEVSVYRQAIAELGVEPVVLPDNFRSRPGLIRWFNHYFARLLGPPGLRRADYEAAYAELQAGRPATGGTVRLAIHERKEGPAAALAEAEATARLIAGQILAGVGDFAEVPGTGGESSTEPPVAILLRARTHLPLFEAALRRHGVPFVVAKGVGFWSRPEVLDLVNTLHALATEDPLSTVGALRSPLFGLSDQDLQDLVDREWGSPAADQHVLGDFGRYPLDPAAPERVLSAARVLDALRALRERLSVPDLLREIIDRTGAIHALSLDDASGQSLANVERLLERAARLDGRGLLAAAEHFLAQVEAGTTDSEAPIPPSHAKVVLMTVHASKGLQFPVVVVPRCGSRPPSGGGALAHGRAGSGWHVATRALDPQAPVRSRVRTGLLGLLDQRRHDEERAERKRLLYVAATRAQDHLVLLGTQPGSRTRDRAPSTWSEMLASIHGVEDADGQRLLAPTGDGQELEPGERDGLIVVELDDWLDLDPAAAALRPDPPAPTAEDVRRVAPITPSVSLEISPSSLDAFISDPKSWYRRVRLGVPDDVPQRTAVARRLAAARGDVIHSLLEDDVVDDPSIAAARWRARAHAEGALPSEVEDGLPFLLAHLERAAADDRVTRRLLVQGMAEVRFRRTHTLPDGGSIVLTGAIDRLWRDEDGRWVVLDWKSESVQGSPIDAARRHARQLLAYAWAADRILRAHGEAGVSRAEVYFTATGDLVQLGPLDETHFRAVETELECVAEIGAWPWERVLSEQPRARDALGELDLGATLLDPEGTPVTLEPAPALEPAAESEPATEYEPAAESEPAAAYASDVDMPPWTLDEEAPPRDSDDEPGAAGPMDEPDVPVPDEEYVYASDLDEEMDGDTAKPAAEPQPQPEPPPPPQPEPEPEPEPEPQPEPEPAPEPTAPPPRPQPTPNAADPYQDLRKALGLRAPPSGTTPVPPPPRVAAPPAPPEPPPREPDPTLDSQTEREPEPTAEELADASPTHEELAEVSSTAEEPAALEEPAPAVITDEPPPIRPTVSAESADDDLPSTPPPTEDEVRQMTAESPAPDTPPPPPQRRVAPPRRRRRRRNEPDPGQLSLFGDG